MNNEKLSANHTPYNWAMSSFFFKKNEFFLEDSLSSACIHTVQGVSCGYIVAINKNDVWINCN